MRAVVLVLCLLCAVVVAAAYHYRDSWYGGSWLESWVQPVPTVTGTAEPALPNEPSSPSVDSPASASTQGAVDASAPPADSLATRLETALAESGVVSAGTTAKSTAAGVDVAPNEAGPRDRRAQLGAEVAEAVEAKVALAATRHGPGADRERVLEGVADVVGDAVGTALADTIPAEETPAVAEAVAIAVAEAVAAAGPAATDQETAEAVSRAVESVVAEKQARGYIARITEPDPDPVSVERADHFVTQDQVITLLPKASLEVTSLDALMKDPALDLDTPITVVHEVEQIEIVTPEKLIANAAGELDRPLTIVKQPYRLESATVAELLRRKREFHPDTVFYVRTVAATDVQGIWGIVFDSLVENYARGMSFRHGDQVETYRVDIPRDADELLSDKSSSYLGRMIHAKTMQSYVYNFRENRMGRNPDRIVPGQEIVIIDFRPEELIGIYKHFLAPKS